MSLKSNSKFKELSKLFFLYILHIVTNNIIVNEWLIYLLSTVFLVLIFPIHVFNYVYINTEEKYASVNLTLFRYIRILSANTVKDKFNEMQINGKNTNLDFGILKSNFYKIFNKLCIQKVVQLTDFGIQSQANIYAALAQNALTAGLYGFLKINGNRVKLRNYAILNQEHSSIRYYAKAVSIVNLLVVIKIMITILTEKLNERKI